MRVPVLSKTTIVMPVMVGTGIAASFGCLIKGGDVLEHINGITMVVFDKTGTLTAGSPSVKDLINVVGKFKPQKVNPSLDILPFTKEELLTVLHVCESSSEHPLAQAMIARVKADHPPAETDTTFTLEKFQNVNGEGIVARISRKPPAPTAEEADENAGATNQLGEAAAVPQEKPLTVLCGNDKLLSRFNIDLDFNHFRLNIESLEKEGKTVVCMVINDIPRLLISMEEDHLAKPESVGVVEYLRDVMHMKVAMITGDNEHAAMKVARHLGIPTPLVTFRAYPNDKARAVRKYQQQGEKVMFVGDGVNDSPVLAQADVGVAINSASDITVQAAGIVAMKDRLDDVINAMLIAKQTFRRIKINFGWAFVYNIVLVPIAMGVLYPIGASPARGNPAAADYEEGSEGLQLDPMWAGFAMALSSVSVVLSSLCLKTFRYKSMAEMERSVQASSKGAKVDMRPSYTAEYTTE